jgi:hypothetical protein
MAKNSGTAKEVVPIKATIVCHQMGCFVPNQISDTIKKRECVSVLDTMGVVINCDEDESQFVRLVQYQRTLRDAFAHCEISETKEIESCDVRPGNHGESYSQLKLRDSSTFEMIISE